MTILLQNLTVERLWPQVNSRVNYPINWILVKMEEDEVIDISDSVTTCLQLEWRDLWLHGISTPFQVLLIF